MVAAVPVIIAVPTLVLWCHNVYDYSPKRSGSRKEAGCLIKCIPISVLVRDFGIAFLTLFKVLSC